MSQKKKLIVITGPAGSGKSTVSREIVKLKGYNIAYNECSFHLYEELSRENPEAEEVFRTAKSHPIPEIRKLTREYLQACGKAFKRVDSLYLVKRLVTVLSYDYHNADYVTIIGIRRQDELDYLSAKADIKLHIKLKGKALSDTDYSHESESEVEKLVVSGQTVEFENTYDETFKTTIRMFMYGWLHGESLMGTTDV